MNLEDLFVSHKQVFPVEFDKNYAIPFNPIYFNLDRVKKVTGETDTDEDDDSETETKHSTTDMSSWDADRNYKPKTTSSTTATSTTSSEKWINPYSNSKDKWIADMTAAYRKAGLTDNAIKNLIAKNALESGWGKYAQGDFNFGNLTTGSNWTGRYVQGKDKDSKGNPIGQKFRAYDSLDAYVIDEIQFLTKLYDFDKNDDFETFIGKLQGNNSGKRKYAGVSDYANRVRRVYNSI
jgi:flagellum-specific peptidoglycan hydrolase FlgJ